MTVATDAFETALLQHIFQNAAIANIGDAAGLLPSAAAGSLFVSLHTADPGEAGTQTTNETTFSNYARQGVVRSAAGWTISGNNASNAAAVLFPVVGATGATITHIGIGVAVSGASLLLFKIPLTASRVLATGDQLNFAIGEIDTNVD
jgi:hypothetical protein